MVLLFAFCSYQAFAYTPSSVTTQNALLVSGKINAYLNRQFEPKKTTFLTLLGTRLPVLQTSFIQQGKADVAYLYEYIRRHLPGVDLIDTPDVIDDDGRGVTWTHAAQGFDILYNPYSTPTFGSLDPNQTYRALLNGTYFARTEWGNYNAGLLWINGQRQTPFVNDDPQITHILCLDASWKISLWENSAYTSEDMLQPCALAFQAGPLIYEDQDGIIQENLAQKLYIGSAHARTVMVIFTLHDGTQDVWFLTFYAKVTLSEVRDIVLSETRFYGEYNDIQILNLDGGSSVAYTSRAFPQLDFWKGKTLPIVIGIK